MRVRKPREPKPRNYPKSHILALALEFSKRLRTEEKILDAVEANLKNRRAGVVVLDSGARIPADEICESHEIRDPNVYMIRAFRKVTGREPKVTSQEDVDLMNAAWGMAKEQHFWALEECQQDEFPTSFDYPEEVLILIARGVLRDRSWNQDVMPHAYGEIATGIGLNLWCDGPIEESEVGRMSCEMGSVVLLDSTPDPGWRRYSVYVGQVDETGDLLGSGKEIRLAYTNDLEEAICVVKALIPGSLRSRDEKRRSA